MDAVQRYGWKDVKSIAQHVGTRTPTQVRTHAQKLFLRQQKEQTGARGQRAHASCTRVASTPPSSVGVRAWEGIGIGLGFGLGIGARGGELLEQRRRDGHAVHLG